MLFSIVILTSFLTVSSFQLSTFGVNIRSRCRFSLKLTHVDEYEEEQVYLNQATSTDLSSEHEWVQHVRETVYEKDSILCESQIQVVDSHLPLIVMDQFLSTEMCRIILDYARQKDGNTLLQTSLMGVSQQSTQDRTSSTLWIDSWRRQEKQQCHSDLCYAIRTLAQKTSLLVGLPISHFENLQVVRYLEGQQFLLHTDHLQEFNHLECRGRLATCLLYLNDSVEENDFRISIIQKDSPTCIGGETYFPEFDTKIQPKQGRAVFFYNTIQRPGQQGYHPLMNLDVNLKARHAGSTVHKGEKWICNFWVHPVPLYNES